MDNKFIKGNKLIVKFMGLKTYKHEEQKLFCEQVFGGVDITAWDVEASRFHESFDWLMPVVNKIEEFTFDVKKDEDEDHLSFHPYLRTFSNVAGVRINRFPLHKEETKILSTWCAVVEFIEWYKDKIKFDIGN